MALPKPTKEELDAIRLIRKELIVKDEPLKAYNFLWNLPRIYQRELKDEMEKSAGMVRHYFSPDEYEKAYDIPVPDAHLIEAEDIALDAGKRYERYQWILEELKAEKAESLLDLGCYVGSLVLTAAKMGYRAWGIDMTKEAIDIANQRKDKFGIRKANFFVQDVRLDPPVLSDLVVSLEVLEHIPAVVKYIKMMARTANKWAYVSTPNGPYGNGEGNLNMEGGWDWHGDKDYRGHLRVFTEKTLRQLIEVDADCEIALLEARDDQLLHCKFRQKGK